MNFEMARFNFARSLCVMVAALTFAAVRAEDICQNECVRDVYSTNCGGARCNGGTSPGMEKLLCNSRCINAIGGGSLEGCLASTPMASSAPQMQIALMNEVETFCVDIGEIVVKDAVASGEAESPYYYASGVAVEDPGSTVAVEEGSAVADDDVPSSVTVEESSPAPSSEAPASEAPASETVTESEVAEESAPGSEVENEQSAVASESEDAVESEAEPSASEEAVPSEGSMESEEAVESDDAVESEAAPSSSDEAPESETALDSEEAIDSEAAASSSEEAPSPSDYAPESEIASAIEPEAAASSVSAFEDDDIEEDVVDFLDDF